MPYRLAIALCVLFFACLIACDGCYYITAFLKLQPLFLIFFIFFKISQTAVKTPYYMRVYAVKKILQSTPLCYNKPYNKKSGNNRVFPSGHNIRRHPKENAMRANNLTLLTDLYELTMMQGYFKNPTNQTVVFDMFYRNNPCDGGFAICAGLEQMIE